MKTQATRALFGAALLCVLALLPCAPQAQAQTAHFSGAVSMVGSGFNRPYSAAVDRSGNVFVAEQGTNTVKEIVAGTGGAASGTVNSHSTVNLVGSGFSCPVGAAVDGSGNVFVADTCTHTVDEIVAGTGGAASGTVNSHSTVNPVASGFNTAMGVAVDGNGNVFVADPNGNAVKEIVAVGGVVSSSSTVITVGSGFSYPYGVTVDASGNVFVADPVNGCVSEIVAVGGVVSGSSTVNTVGSGFYEPHGVAVDGSGNVFVADTGNSAVKEIVAVDGVVSGSSIVNTVASGFYYPYGVGVDGSGNVFVADMENNAVKEIVLGAVNFGSVAVAAATPPTTLTFYFDTGGTILAPAVLTQGAAGKDFTDAGTGTCTANGTSHTYAVGDTCTVVVEFTPKWPGQRLGAVQLIGSGGTVIATENVYGTGTGPMVTFPSNTTVTGINGGFNAPFGVAVDGSGNVFVAEAGNSQVKEIVAVGGVVSGSSAVNTVGSGFSYADGVAVDGSGNVFVADTNSSSVKEIVAVGGMVSSSSTVNIVGSGFNQPEKLAVDGSGNVFVADTMNGAVKEIVAVGGAVSSASTVKTINGGFSTPYGVAVDGSGNVFVADYGHSAVKEIVAVGGVVSNTSTVKTVGSGFTYPDGIAVDGNGNVFVVDYSNTSVKEIVAVGGVVSSSSTVITVASGFSHPYGVAVDGSGNVFVGDTGNGLVKEVDLSDPPSLSFASTETGSTSSPQTVTVANSGNADLTFPIPATDNNPSIAANFTLNSSGGSACPLLTASTSSPATLASGSTCTLPISFTPTTFGTISGSLVLTDTNLNASSPGYATQSISLSGTATGATVALTSSPNLSNLNTSVTLRATVAGGSSTPTGTVTFKSNGATIAGCSSGNPVTLDGAGTAECDTASLSAGTDSLTADYSGDSTYLPKTSNTVTQTVNALAATLSVTPSPASPQPINTSVTFTTQLAGVALTPVVPTGTVTFLINGSSSADCPAATVTSSGSATCTTSSLHVGSNTVTATYAGGSNYTVATAGTASYTVTTRAATLGVNASPASPSSVNTSVTFTAQLASVALSPITPSGSVSFKVNGSSSPDCPDKQVTSSGSATCTTSSLHAGSNSIAATYGGDSNFTVATAGTATQTVNPMSTTTVLNSTPDTSSHWTVDHPVTLTATVAPSPSGTAYVPYSGSVTFTDTTGSITGCSSAVAVNPTTGVASCIATALAAGNHSITATYAGDTNYNGNPSSALGNPVDKAATTTVVTSSSSGNHSTVNDSVTFTAALAPNPVPSVANELAISGSVAFYMDGSSTPIGAAAPCLRTAQVQESPRPPAQPRP